RPFQVLDGVVNGLTSGDLPPDEVERLREELGEWSGAASAAVPGLAPLLGTADTDLLPEAYGENRSVDALTILLGALGRPGRPVLVVLDDCQWADRLTIALLASWQGPRGLEGAGQVMVVAAYRSE